MAENGDSTPKAEEPKRARRCRDRKAKQCRAGDRGEVVYGLGLIGAAIYYIQAADTFWWGVVGFLKALVWPVFLVYELLKHVAT